MRRVLLVAAAALVAACHAKTLTVVSAGDAFMVRRLPKEYGMDARMRDWIASADARLVNFEAVVTDGTCPPAAWSGGTWAGMAPDVVGDLFSYGFNGCGCANNHSLDYSAEGLRMTRSALQKAGIPFAGIGRDLQEAAAPAFVETPNGRVAVISVCSTFHPDARAGWRTASCPGRPGLNGLRRSETVFVTPAHMKTLREIAAATAINGRREVNQKDGFTPPDAPGTFVFGGIAFAEAEKEGRTTKCHPGDLKRLCGDIARARAAADCVVVLAHSHGIRERRHCEAAAYFEEFCRAAIDAGAAAVFGGGTHQLKGVELRNGRPIFYSLGNFLFQNNFVPTVPPDFCEQFGLPPDAPAEKALAARSKNGKVGLHTDRANYLSVLPRLELVDGEVRRVTLLPIELGFGLSGLLNGLPRVADAKAAADIEAVLATLSAPYGTAVLRLGDGTLELRPR